MATRMIAAATLLVAFVAFAQPLADRSEEFEQLRSLAARQTTLTTARRNIDTEIAAVNSGARLTELQAQRAEINQERARVRAALRALAITLRDAIDDETRP